VARESLETQGQKKLIKVFLFDQHDTHFASFDMPELPRADDVLEIGFPGQSVVRSFIVNRVVHKMIQIPAYETKFVDGVAIQSMTDPPWCWEYRLHGYLFDPENDYSKAKCICAPGVTECPKHGNQPAARDICPLCEKAVLGYCAEGVYCTDDGCSYVA
jgi:hypothetical protein